MGEIKDYGVKFSTLYRDVRGGIVLNERYTLFAEKPLKVTGNGRQILNWIEGLSANDILALQLIDAENPMYLNLNATLHHQFKIDNALEIIAKLKDRNLIRED